MGALAETLAHRCGLGSNWHTDTIAITGQNLESTLRNAAPAVIELGDGREFGVLSVRRSKARVVAEDGSVSTVTLDDLFTRAIERHAEKIEEVDAILDSCGSAVRARGRARRAIVVERLARQRLGTVTLISRDPGASFVRQCRDAGLLRTLLGFASAHALESILWLIVWWAAGQAALTGRIDRGWMLGWLIPLAALVPVRIAATWMQGRFAIGASGLLRQRLLTGALRLKAGEVAHAGAGQFFSRVTEAGSLETLALSGGMMSAVALLEIAIAGAVLWLAASGVWLSALFALWLAVTAAVAWRYSRERSRWTDARLAITHDAIEQMTGHRTRLAQEPPEHRHESEDAALDQYHSISSRLDRWGVRLAAHLPQAWLVAAFAALAPSFIGGAPAASLAAALGGILLAQQALKHLTAGAANLAGALVAWRSVAPLFRAAENIPARAAAAPANSPKVVVEASGIEYRHRDGGRPVLDDTNVRIERGDWVLLEGPSGGGKSTLVSVLSGLREPASGLLTSGGLDRKTIGADAWRARIATAPQYHENHILTGSLAFNLLMGRGWPPEPKDFADALEICKELGLGGLLERMPSGLHQVVGETGWQLSQGERSRIFLARALLQNSEMAILDESFAALDPENLRQAMECALRRSKTLLVVAHP
jgi:ATP-binding cassette subfamily B protein